ncbi:Enhancer of ag-4 protein [Thalictrum thalictroides]|uniref:Enhancer of ag-4 protein n=1 Tax=Thalictrum thalictroides TaxID=46969 RepID=A0A7J6VRP1_THATH|nr:Enhancer of ag-4 protein [Thalictrum thalictroides]
MAPSRRRASSKASSAAAAAAAVKKNWKVGDLVLAKVKGFPAWPATVSEPEKWGYSSDWKKVLVFFFGTKQIAFCNHADVEAFTEEKKKSLLSKRHGKGADFVRAVQEIVDCYEKSKEQEQVDEVKSGDEGTMAGNLEDSMAKGNKIQSPMIIAKSGPEALCFSDNNNESHHLIDEPTERENGFSHDMETPSGNPVQNLSSVDELMGGPLLASDSLRIRSIDAPLQNCINNTSVRRPRSTVKVEPCKILSQVMANGNSTNSGDLLNGTRNESAKRSRRSRKSPATSAWHHMESPGYSTAVASNVSSEDNGSEIGTTSSDTISFNCGNTLETSCKVGQPGIDVACVDRGAQSSDKFRPTAEILVFKKKRKANRKRVADGEDSLAVNPKENPGLDIQVKETMLHHSPDTFENLPDRVSRANGDEHLPLVKRARVRMGKPLSEEKHLNGLVHAEESCKGVLMNNSEPPLASSSCGEDVHDANGSTATNGYIHTEKEPIWNASKYQLRGSVDGEAALPPSKRLHRALEAMCANAAEEGQTFDGAQETTKLISSEKSSHHMSLVNEVGTGSEVKNVNSFGDIDANVRGESKVLPGLTSPTSEVFEKSKSCDHLVECSNILKSEDCKEMALESSNCVDDNNVDDSSLKSSSGETKVSIKSPPCSSSFEHKQGVLGSRLEQLDDLLPSPKEEKTEILRSSNGSSNNTVKLEHASFLEDKLGQENGASQQSCRDQDSSETNTGDFPSPAGGSAHLSPVNVDPCKSLKSLVSPLDKSVHFICELEKEARFKPAEKDRDANSMKVLIAAAQAKRQLSHSNSLSDNVLDDKIVCESTSSPSSVGRVGSYEQVTPTSSVICHLSTNKNPQLRNGGLDVLLHCKKSTRVLGSEEVRNFGSSVSHREKSVGKWTSSDAHAVRKSFESVLGNLSRTKESIGRATRLAIDCAKYGIAGEVLEILVRKLETESSLHKRVDLFFLVDSITQYSRGQKGGVGDMYTAAVQAMLPRLLSAAAPPGHVGRENRKQCHKVLKLWLERKTFPESIVRHHMRELDSNDASLINVHIRRPLRMERALNDPIREMEGMHVNEYGSNASIQLPGFCMPPMLEDEGSDGEDRSFEAVTPEQDSQIPVEREATPMSAFGKHCHILEDVDGELEMEDVAPSFEVEKSSYDASGVHNAETSNYQFGQHLPVPCAPPLPGHFPPSPPPLPASPPPMVPPPPPLPPQAVISHPFTDSGDMKFHTNAHNMECPSQRQHISQLPDTVRSIPAMSDTMHYYAPGYKDLGKQSVRPGSFGSSNSCCNAPAAHPSVHMGNSVQQIDSGSLHNKGYHLQPPPPTLSNQFSYVHADQRRQSWMEASSSSYTKRFRYGLDMHRDDVYDHRDRMDLAPYETRERCRVAAPVHLGRVQSDYPEAAYGSNYHYGPPQEPSRLLNRGLSFPPRTTNYYNPAPYRPPEAPNFWRPR